MNINQYEALFSYKRELNLMEMNFENFKHISDTLRVISWAVLESFVDLG